MSALNRKLKSILSQPKPKSMIAAELESLVRDRERAAAEAALRGFVRRVSDSIEDYWSIATLDALGAEYIRAAALGLTAGQEEGER